MQLLLAAIIGYSLGSVSFATIISRKVKGIDIRKYKSGTAGTLNVWRLLGPKYGILVACLDISKGVIAAAIGYKIAGEAGQMTAGCLSIIGHIFPIWFQFRGGKALATSFGLYVFIAPIVTIPLILLWLALYSILRHSARVSLITFCCVPIVGWIFRLPRQKILFLGIIGLIVALKHIPDLNRPRKQWRPQPSGKPERSTPYY